MPNGKDEFGLKLIGSLVAIIATCLGGFAYVSSQINDLRFDMQAVLHQHDTRLRAAEFKLEALPARDRWRGQDMIVWSRDLKERNQGLDVPDPREVIRDRSRADGPYE